MIINGNTFAYGAFQLDTRPLYITLSHDETAQKWVSDVNYTADQIIEMSKTRQVIAKVIATNTTVLYAPLTQVINIGSNTIVFGAIIYSNPTDLSLHWFVEATCDESGAWDVVLDDQN